MPLRWNTCWDDTHSLYVATVGGGRYFFIEVTNMPDACGSDATYEWDVQLAEVDMLCATSTMIKNALSAFGVDPADHELDEAAVAQLLYEGGTKMPLDDYAGNNRSRGIAAMRRAANTLISDADAYDEAMNKEVNKIGSTPLEFFRADFSAAVERGTMRGDKHALLMAKINGNIVEEDGTLRRVGRRLTDAELDSLAPSAEARKDLLAFQSGIIAGRSGERIDPDPAYRAELSAAYLEGYRKGMSLA